MDNAPLNSLHLWGMFNWSPVSALILPKNL
jgi:hypothetical protein